MKNTAQSLIYYCFIILAVNSVIVSKVSSVDLLEVFRMAESSDPQFRQVAANKRAVLEQRPQALANLLPSINFSANYTANTQENIISGFGTSGTSGFESSGYNINLTQPIFRSDRYFRLQQADSTIKQADAELIAAELDLTNRVAVAYFNVLAAIDNLNFAEAEKRSLSRQLEQSKQRFEAGLTAITDVQEAQAGYDLAVADEIQAINDIDNAREAIREITGEYLLDLDSLTENMPLVSPTPADIDAWSDIAVQENLDVIAATYAVDNARKEIKAQFSGHLPTADLVLSRNFNVSGGRFGDSEITSEAIGLQFTVPIYSGGAVNSRMRESQERLDQQLERLNQVRRQAHRQTREAYLGVISGISRIKALKQAVVSSETALQATQAGFEVGTRTAVDVVQSERTTFQTKRDLSRARYDYIVNTLSLKEAAGVLTIDDISEVNKLLQ